MIGAPDADEVRGLFTYDEQEGLLRWKNPSGKCGRIPAGTIAGTPNKEAYRYICIRGKLYRASRLIWLYMTGEWPKHQVDHKNRTPSDDRWENLREATSAQNKANCKAYRKKSCTLKGVQAVQKKHSIRYYATVTKDKKRIHLGCFGTEEEAHAAYVKASEALHGEFSYSG